MDTKFWGVEVKSGEIVKVEPGDHNYAHLSQVSLGEIKKDKQSDMVTIYVTVDGKELVIGSLSAEKCTQISLDLVFQKEFKLSHNWKNGSVFFCGHRSIDSEEEDNDDNSDSSSEEDAEMKNENGKPEVKVEQTKQVIDKPKTSKPDAGLTKLKASTGPVVVDGGSKDSDSESDDGDDEDDSNNDEVFLTFISY